jgi:hypothetical protein
MTEVYEAGEAVPDGLFYVDGERETRLTFDVPVRVYESSDLRHVYPDESVHSVEDVVSPEESSPHTTVFEGVNTVLYFDPRVEQ